MKGYWKLFQLLECLGFKIMFTEINPVWDFMFEHEDTYVSLFYDVVWARDQQWEAFHLYD